MLTKAQNKYIRSLTQQKFRNESKVFIAEGEKICLEWLHSAWNIAMIVATDEWAKEQHAVISKHTESELIIVKDSELKALSALHTPNKVILVVRLPEKKPITFEQEWYLALDDLQDPGNMGTIIRIADWFGIRSVICSPGCVDAFNPKVVQSAMGGHLRVNVYEADLVSVLTASGLQVYAATLNGTSIYDIPRQQSGILVIGNESRGVSEAVAACATRHVTIPGKGGAESLNAGVSAGILCAMLLPC